MADLTPEQKTLVDQLKKSVASLIENDAALRVFCNEHTYVRYLRARGWNLTKADHMLRATLQWRTEYKPHAITFEEVKDEFVTGKNWVYHVPDKKGRPLILMRPRNQNTKTYDRQQRSLIYLLEQASRLADMNGVHQMCWLLDFEGYSMSNAPPLKMSLACNHILQHHYPERLGLAVCYHSPTLFSLTWKAVRPFVDPVTQGKIVFADKGAGEFDVMNNLFDLNQMESCMGGRLPGDAFKWEPFSADCRAHDAAVSLAIKEMDAMLQSSGSAHISSSADLEVAVVAPDMHKVAALA